jgi:hypothetical protein
MNSSQTAVHAQDVSSYLASKGWHRDGDWRGASVWRLGTEARLLVPDLHEYDDASELIQDAVAKIARYEARPERDVWQDIAEPMVDAQFFRMHPDAPAGSIALPAGVKATQSILDLMKSAATAVERGSYVLVEGRRTPRIDSFLHTILLSYAAPGSYILTARVPTAEVGPQQLAIFDGSREFSGRSVVAQLHTALEAARVAAARALVEHGDLDAFYASVQSGVSPNMCKALGELGGEKRNLPFEIGFTWARGVPGQVPANELEFTSAMPAILARAGDELAALASAGNARITGLITDLHDERNEPPRIKIRGELQTSEQARFSRRSIWVAVSPVQYSEAIEAHRRGQQVQAAGRLATTGRRLELLADSFHALT